MLGHLCQIPKNKNQEKVRFLFHIIYENISKTNKYWNTNSKNRKILIGYIGDSVI